ncbi:hypothetical protein LCGC14_0728890 [marine sediment metagenome]|uniref:Uncharacterized protein n=1 Tax=marine sediment metagenome TaxID=412755 RepID=A0A0F9QV71_9ZZZZ
MKKHTTSIVALFLAYWIVVWITEPLILVEGILKANRQLYDEKHMND